jgi:hypothetical protein
MPHRTLIAPSRCHLLTTIAALGLAMPATSGCYDPGDVRTNDGIFGPTAGASESGDDDGVTGEGGVTGDGGVTDDGGVTSDGGVTDDGADGSDSSDGGDSSDGDDGSDSGDSGEAPVLDPNVGPGENFDLGLWKITFPDASEEEQAWLVAGNERENEFYTDPVTGGMVFRCPNMGETTSGDTQYSRTELREMLRGEDTEISTQGINGNNWVTSTSSADHRDAAGGVDGTLQATLSVDHVSTTYDEEHMVGRVIVGQIHGPDQEPCKIYYRKLPQNSKGSVYFSYEPEEGSDIIIPLIGSPDDDASDPADGIALGEQWSYEIDVVGHLLEVTITREDGSTVSDSVTMDAYYDDAYLYFKAGVYNQNSGGSEGDHVQATFYALTHTHD